MGSVENPTYPNKLYFFNEMRIGFGFGDLWHACCYLIGKRKRLAGEYAQRK